MATHLFKKFFMHYLTIQDTFLSNKGSTAQHFILDQYAETIFEGIMPDTSAAKVSTTEKSQLKVLQYEIPEIELDTTHTNEASICFGSRLLLSSIDTIQVLIPVGTINFYIVDTSTPFFPCLKNMDTFGIYLNNIINQFIYQNGKSILIFRKWGHFWFFVKSILALDIHQSISCISY